MTTKTYISPTVLSIRTNDGTRVTFEELSEGRGGIFTTSNDRIQREIEAHPLYGKRFRLKETVSAQAAAQAAEEKEKQEILKIEGMDISDAKEYLADHFGISRTQLRSKEQIRKAAEANNVEFVGL